MSTFSDNARQTFTAGGAIGKYQRVKFASGVVTVAGLADRGNGFAENDAANGESVAVLLDNGPGSRKCYAAKAIAASAVVHSAASGKLSDTAAATSYPLGYCKVAAGEDGDLFEIIPFGGYPAANE